MKVAMGVATAALLFTSAAQAESMYWSARVGPTLGLYKGEVELRLTDIGSGESESVTDEGDWETTYGLQTGLSVGFGDFFGDIGIEYQRIDFQEEKLDRTDVLLTGGYLLNQNWSVFGGYRRGMQGDGAFNDDTFSESGFFIGAGLAGIDLGAVVFGASLAYNFSKVDDFPDDGLDFDYHGISLKGSLALKNAPQHSLQLRYQRFSGDDAITFDDGADSFRLDYELTESYIQLSYLYAFAF